MSLGNSHPGLSGYVSPRHKHTRRRWSDADYLWVDEVAAIAGLRELVFGEMDTARSDIPTKTGIGVHLSSPAQQAGMRLGNILRGARDTQPPRVEQIGDAHVVAVQVIHITNDVEVLANPRTLPKPLAAREAERPIVAHGLRGVAVLPLLGFGGVLDPLRRHVANTFVPCGKVEHLIQHGEVMGAEDIVIFEEHGCVGLASDFPEDKSLRPIEVEGDTEIDLRNHGNDVWNDIPRHFGMPVRDTSVTAFSATEDVGCPVLEQKDLPIGDVRLGGEGFQGLPQVICPVERKNEDRWLHRPLHSHPHTITQSTRTGQGVLT